MRIIVAGAGEIGSHLAKMLSMEYHEITVISPDEESLERISGESDIITVEGISSSIETLLKAGVQNATFSGTEATIEPTLTTGSKAITVQ